MRKRTYEISKDEGLGFAASVADWIVRACGEGADISELEDRVYLETIGRGVPQPVCADGIKASIGDVVMVDGDDGEPPVAYVVSELTYDGERWDVCGEDCSYPAGRCRVMTYAAGAIEGE